MKLARILLAVGIVSMTHSLVWGTNPDPISFQGNLSDQTGDPVPDGSYSMTFGIWDSETGGNLLWSETQAVEVTGGAYNVSLGSVNPLGLDIFGIINPEYLPAMEVTVEGEILSPRISIASTPYSKIASRIDGDVETGIDLQGTPFIRIGDPGGPDDLGDRIITTDHNIFFNSTIGDPDSEDNRPPFGVNFTSVNDLPGLPDTTIFGPGGLAIVDIGDETEVSRTLTVTVEDVESMAETADERKVASYSAAGITLSRLLSSDPNSPDTATFNTDGIMFADPSSGDMLAQYGPGGAMFSGIGGNPDLPDLASYGPGGAVFIGIGGTPDMPVAAFHPFNGIMFADTTAGDTVAQYGPGGAVFVQLQPEPPSPDIASYGPGGAVFTGIGVSPDMPIAAFHPLDGIMFADTSDGDTVAQYTPDQIFLKGPGGPVDPFDLQIDAGGVVFGVEPDFLPQAAYGGGGVTMKDAQGAITVQITNQGSMSLGLDAGATQTVGIGERYRDNAIVAWGRVSGSGALQSDFGVASASRSSTGIYTIGLDATAIGTGHVIPMAVAEVESPPASASAARLLTVNQVSDSFFDVYITDGNFSPADNDFLFMVTAR